MSLLANSPFKDKIDSFLSPSGAQLDAIRAFLVEPRSRLAQLDVDIANTEAALARLKIERDTLNSEILLYESLLSPIRHIPPYILQEIFLACLPTEHNAVIDPSQPPLLFGRVCRYWRELSHATPLLWNRVHVCGLQDGYTDFPMSSAAALSSPPAEAAFQSFLRQWISRSRDSALSFSYIERPFPTKPNDDALDGAALRCVIEFHTRLENLTLWSSISWLSPILSLDAVKVSSLRLIGRQDFDFDADTTALQNAAILKAPGLTSLFLFVAIRDPLALPCQWSNLTELGLFCEGMWEAGEHIGGLGQSTLLTIFRRCPNLVRCELAITADSLIQAPTPTVVLPNLTELYLCLGYMPNWVESDVVLGLLEHITLPKLRVLCLVETVSFLNIQVDPMRRADVSGPDDLAVYMNPSRVETTTMLAILRRFPRATRIHLVPHEETSSRARIRWTTPLDEQFFDALADDLLCPLLAELEMVLTSSEVRHTGIMSFLRARIPRLHSVTLTFRTAEKADVEEELREMESRGLRLKLFYESEDSMITPAPKWRYEPRRGLAVHRS
ncbi:hypothetical protein C8F01DRAFT_1112710 [Mycena amicta]|nr:hypothetical protein C8F01DRAFT_1112710 [Mycena amicta]